MAINYVLVERANLQKPEAPKKFYAQAKTTGEVTLKTLSKEIAEGSTTVSDTDVLAVINDLTKFMRRHLAEGKIVRLGDFGDFRISIGSEGAETEKKFNASLIRDPKVKYRPGADVIETLNNLKYEKA